MAAGVGGVVDAGLVAGSGGHEESFVGGEGDDAAEVEGFGAGYVVGDPDVAVGGAEVGTVRAGSPGDFLRDGAYAAEIFCDAGEAGLRGGLSEGGSGCEEEEQGSHGGIVSDAGGIASR